MDNLGNSNSSVSAGRLEVNNQDPWSSVCGIGFSLLDADTACRVLGFKFANRFGSVGALGYVSYILYIVEQLNIKCTPPEIKGNLPVFQNDMSWLHP